jgi:hypothetical protein
MGLIPTKSYEDILGDGLEVMLARKATTLSEFITGLNDQNIRGPSGQVWTVELLRSELQRLGV